MLNHDKPDLMEHLVKTNAEGKTFIGPGPDGGGPDDREVLSSYRPQPGNPVFMTLIERTFGKDVTTRTWDALARIVAKAPR